MRRRRGTVERHAAGIANLFAQHGLASPTRTFEHKKLIDRLRRLEQRPTKKARPLLGVALDDLLLSYDTSTLRGARDAAIAALGGNRGPRSATIVSIRIEHVSFPDRGVKIGLRDQKTSRSRDLEYMAEPHRRNHFACTPCAMQHYFSLLGSLSEGPFFRAIDRWGNVSNRPMTPKSISYILRKNLARAGNPEADSYSSHSFRHGVVTTAARKHWPIEEMMLVTMHRSKRSLLEYVQCIDPWYDAPARSVLDEKLTEDDAERGWIH